MVLAGSPACKSKASCGQVLAGKKASPRIWSKTVRFLCCRIKNLSAGWPPSRCQVLAAWQKQGKARKAKPGHPGKATGGQDALVTGPGCTGKARQGKLGQDTKAKSAAPARGQEALAKPPGMARKLWQKASAQRRGPRSTGKATQERAEEAPAKPPRGAQDTPAKAPRGGPGHPGNGGRTPRQVPGFRVYTFVIATSVRVITCRVKQLWRPSVSALPEPPDLCHQSLADRSDGFGLPGWVTSPQPDFRV